MKLSIIICTHNSGERLRKTLDSILSQDADDFEVVIIDGASTDGTINIIKEYELKFNGKLRWISEPDSGVYNAMNKGVKMARGEYLNIVGAGDWLEKSALKAAYKCIEENPETDAVQGVLRIWSKDLMNFNLVQTSPKKLATVPMQHPSLYYKKELHNKYGLYDESYKIVADYLFCMKAFYVGRARVTPFDAVVDNYLLDGMSSNNDELCEEENIRARKSLGLNRFRFLRNIIMFFK